MSQPTKGRASRGIETGSAVLLAGMAVQVPAGQISEHWGCGQHYLDKPEIKLTGKF